MGTSAGSTTCSPSLPMRATWKRSLRHGFGFRILTPGPIQISKGTLIQYKLSLRGLPIRWTTEIRLWEPPHQFVDVQLRGPYRLWHHTHRFREENGGTRMQDLVRYSLPFGPLGRLVNALQVRRDVERIFDYRRERIAAMWTGLIPRGRPAVRPTGRSSVVSLLLPG